MQKLHIDVWTPNLTAFDVYLINTSPVLVEQKVTIQPTLFGWNSIDIPLSQYTTVNLNNISQFKFVGAPLGTGVLYWDNLYFWKSSSLSTPTISITQPSCLVSTGSVAVTSSSSGLTFSINGTNYLNNGGNFSGLVAGNYSMTAKDSNGNVSSAVPISITAYNDTIPSVPSVISGTLNINQCDTLQTYSVTPVPGLIYTWLVTGVGNRVFSGQGTNSAVLVMKSAGIVSVAARKCTTNGPARTLSVLKAAPAAPTVLNANSLNVCLYTESAFSYTGVRDTFRTNTLAGATGYIFETPAGSTVQRLNDTTITVLFADTMTVSTASPKFVKVYATSSCDTSLAKSVTLTRSVVAAPTAITITPMVTNVCGARTYRYSAPALPAGAYGYVWSLEGTLSEFANIDSGDINSRKMVVTYSSNDGASAGDSIKLYYVTGCGNSVTKAAKLSNTKLNVPTAPASVTIQSVQTNVCGARIYRYIAPVLPVASTTAGAATGYVWSFVGSLSGTMTIDSGSLTSRILKVRFTSTAAAAAGDSVRVLYTSTCGNSLRKTAKLSNMLLAVPTAPATVTIQIASDVCGARKYRYTAPNLPVATATAGPASGYLWTLPTGTVGSTGSLDSGTLSSQKLVIVYTSNAAAGAGDSIRVRYTSGCGNSNVKAQKLSNLVKVCGSFARPETAVKPTLELTPSVSVYPNPNNGQFRVVVNGSPVQEGQAMIDVMDMRGKSISRIPAMINQGMMQKTISQSGLSNGIYLVRVTIGKTTQVVRMVVQQ